VIRGADYDLFAAGVLSRIKASREQFINCVIGNYLAISEDYGCKASLSKSRLLDAHAFWVDDLERTLKSGISPATAALDQYKHAAFLTFWLRRFHPLEKLDFLPEDMSDPHVQAIHSWFSLYANEICALHIGLKPCTGYFLASIADAASSSTNVSLFSSKDQLIRRLAVSLSSSGTSS
jgi:hypothetical protein